MALASALVMMACIGMAQPAAAQTAPGTALERLEGEIRAQREELTRQRSELEAQRQRIEAQEQELQRLRNQNELDAMRGAGMAAQDAPIATGRAQSPPAPTAPAAQTAGLQRPVGEAPPEVNPQPIEALPEGQGVLTPKGVFVLEPSVEYSRSSTNRLVFRGVSVATDVVLIGVIEASDVDRDSLAANLGVRYGLTNRIEVEARAGYFYRKDRFFRLRQADQPVGTEVELDGSGIGDVEFGVRYQINRGRGGRPIYIAGLRVKSDTGTGPFDIARDANGVATELPTGSGFWSIEPSVSFIIPSEPAVIFGGISYVYNMSDDVDQVTGGRRIGEVDPGDSVGANLGFAFSVNPQFSFSLGYRHNFIFETETEIDGVTTTADSLQVGSLFTSLSYRFMRRDGRPGRLLNFGFEFGATEDAPDVRMTLRTPFAFVGPFAERRRR